MNRLLIALLPLTAIFFTSNTAIAQQVNPSQTIPTPNSISTSGAKDLIVNPQSTGESWQISREIDQKKPTTNIILDRSLTITLPSNKQTCGMLEDNTRIGATGERQVVLGCDEF
jgi:hypothetical protein